METATAQAGVALIGSGGIRASFHLLNEGRHAESLAPAIEFVCRQTRTDLKDVTAVVVDVGPGRFTGLRVGVATAKAIAFAGNIPIVPVSSLELLAFPVRLGKRKIVSVIDALSDEVYYGIYEPDSIGGGVRMVAEPVVATPQDLVMRIRAMDEEVLIVGDGGRRYAEAFAGLNHVEIAPAGLQYPSATSLVEIGEIRASRGELMSAADVQIFYLRKPYAHLKE
ncbi:MAG TPA: tRNA (adenosine(37)-N6)-threonylcarbamoyltransferase complex dimerization subunit type 1 TsaB [Thermoanaerobaculia bacterium]|nr:tRNA (adenosine(37)-N6)-threonylcarbamoyltransferase complex dimerization subunit type 1 TsaB [Thermoanaerobaculia bacterium]